MSSLKLKKGWVSWLVDVCLVVSRSVVVPDRVVSCRAGFESAAGVYVAGIFTFMPFGTRVWWCRLGAWYPYDATFLGILSSLTTGVLLCTGWSSRRPKFQDD